MSAETVACSKCGTHVDPLAVFPGGICLECYRPIGDRLAETMTADDVAAMWGARPRGRAGRSRKGA